MVIGSLFFILVLSCRALLTTPPLLLNQHHEDSVLKQVNRNYTTDLGYNFALANSFLVGFKSQLTVPNALFCTKYLELSLEQFNQTEQNWTANNETTGKDKLFDTTKWISYSVGPSSRYCAMSGFDLYFYIQNQTEVFGNFSSWIPAALQNLLANVLTYNQIYQKIVASQQANDTVTLYYWYGRLSYLILIFDPISTTAYTPTNNFTLLQPAVNNSIIDQWGNHTTTQLFQPNVYINVFQFSFGLYTAGVAKTSPNALICQTNAFQVVASSKDFYSQLTNLTRENVQRALIDWQDILGTAYPLTYSCYTGVGEISTSLGGYVTTLTSPTVILTNALVKIDKEYDAVFYLVKYLQMDSNLFEDQSTSSDYYFRLGVYSGLIIQYLLLQPEPVLIPTNDWQPIVEPIDGGF